MDREEQANLSLREIAIRTKEKLRELAVKSPEYPFMFGLKTDKWTTYFFTSPERRSLFVKKHTDILDQKQMKLIAPKKR